jgi:hypothetical protein
LTTKSEGQPASTANGDFGALLADLDNLAKAMPAPDAVAGSGDEDAGGDVDNDGDNDGEDDGDDEEMFGKSLKVTLEDGTESEALDGGMMLKALRTLRGQNRTLGDTVAAQDAKLGDSHKAIEKLTGLFKSQSVALGEQTALVKSLSAKVEELGATGRGRASKLTVLDKPNALETGMPKPAAGASRQEILSKALALNLAGTLQSADVARIEGCLNVGHAIPDYLVKALQG